VTNGSADPGTGCHDACDDLAQAPPTNRDQSRAQEPQGTWARVAEAPNDSLIYIPFRETRRAFLSISYFVATTSAVDVWSRTRSTRSSA